MATPSVFVPGDFHALRSLAGYSLWGRKGSDMTERLSTHVRIRQTDRQTDRQTHRGSDEPEVRFSAGEDSTPSLHAPSLPLPDCFPEVLSTSPLPKLCRDGRTRANLWTWGLGCLPQARR